MKVGFLMSKRSLVSINVCILIIFTISNGESSLYKQCQYNWKFWFRFAFQNAWIMFLLKCYLKGLSQISPGARTVSKIIWLK